MEKTPAVWEYVESASSWKEIIEPDTLKLDRYGITDPTISRRLTDLHASVHGESAKSADSYINSFGWKYMQKLIEPFRGKYLLVDFWDLFCAPCRVEIESSVEFREKYKDSADFDILFLASENGSHPDGWKWYSEKYMPHDASMRLPQLETDILRELFNFSGVPHYVLFDREGRVIDSALLSFGTYKSFLKEKGLIDDLDIESIRL